MNHFVWRTFLSHRPESGLFRSWLQEPASLTQRLQACCGVFRVQVLCQGGLPPERGGVSRQRRQVRQVVLWCDARPVIFAHTELSTANRGRLSLWLKRLGSRSLGSLLFSHPGFQRGPIEFCCLDARHPLYQRAAQLAELPARLWARRSRHHLNGQSVLVTEVFLPAILDLPHRS